MASKPTTWRMLDKIDDEHLPGVPAARAAARERAWAAGAAPDLRGLLDIDFDATVTISHSEDKENVSAAPSFAYDLCARRVTDEQIAELDVSVGGGAQWLRTCVRRGHGRFLRPFRDCGVHPEAFAPAYGLAESTLLVTGSARRRLLTCKAKVTS